MSLTTYLNKSASPRCQPAIPSATPARRSSHVSAQSVYSLPAAAGAGYIRLASSLPILPVVASFPSSRRPSRHTKLVGLLLRIRSLLELHLRGQAKQSSGPSIYLPLFPRCFRTGVGACNSQRFFFFFGRVFAKQPSETTKKKKMTGLNDGPL